MRARTRGRAHARDGLDKKKGVSEGVPPPQTWSRTRGGDFAENGASCGGLGGIWAPEGRQGRSPASCGGLGGIWAPEGRQGRSPASCGGLGASGPPRPSGRSPASCGGLGASGPRGPSGRSPASCGGLGASGPPRAVRPLSGVLWRSGGIWAPEGRQAALRRPVAVWGASGPPRAVRAALRRPVAVWGASGFLDWNFLGS